MHWSAKLRAMGACEEAVNYARTFDSFSNAWAACERGDWMLWILGALSGPPDSDSRRAVVAAAVDCAALAREHASDDTRKAFDRCQRTTRRYLRGAATLSGVRNAAGAARTAADNVVACYAACAAAYVAYAAAYVAHAAANVAACATGATTHAPLAARAASDVCADIDAWRRTLDRCARIIRKHFPNPPAI